MKNTEFSGGSHQALLRHRQRLPLSHDDVVEHAHVHQRQSRLEGLGQVFVGAAGLDRAAGVVVREHHSRGLVVQGPQVWSLAGKRHRISLYLARLYAQRGGGVARNTSSADLVL